jgi:hypothetical protein
VTPPVGISQPLNNIGTTPRVLMTMTAARDDDDGDDGCWEKGKPVRDDLSEPVRSNTGICAASSTSRLTLLSPSLSVFLA